MAPQRDGAGPDTEETLRKEVLDAIGELREARVEERTLMGGGRDAGMHASAGSAAVREAATRHTRALSRLREALKRFDGLLAQQRGERPGQ